MIEKICIWSGAPAIVVFFGGFLIAGFVPPPSPSLSQAAVVAIYQDHTTAIRTGMLLMMISGMFMAPFTGAISVQIKRIPGISCSLVYAQLIAGATNSMFFFFPAIIFLVTAFRPDRPPELTYMMNDLAWICAVIAWPPAFMQSIIIGIAVLNDYSVQPLFPRWLGYLNFWIALCYLPGGLLPFFKSGPFSWSGILVFWLAGTVFVVWFIVMIIMMLCTIRGPPK